MNWNESEFTDIATNGSFEQSANGFDPGYDEVQGQIVGGKPVRTGEDKIKAWRVVDGGVDYIASLWTAPNGTSRSIDLNSNCPGSLSQEVTTEVGTEYWVVFALAGNPQGGPKTKTMVVSATGNDQKSFSFDNTGKTETAMGWIDQVYSFTAKEPTTTITFRSTVNEPIDRAAYGAVIANVRIYKPIDLIKNGSFEEGADGFDPTKDDDNQAVGGKQVLAGEDKVKDWTVVSGGVDCIVSLWQPGDKLNRSIDLNSSRPGSLAQDVPTEQGGRYKVIFALAGNPDGGPNVKTAGVTVTGDPEERTFTFDNTGKSKVDMGWVERSFTFTARSSTTTLTFASKVNEPPPGPHTGPAYGPVIDNVRMYRVPDARA